MEPKYPDIIVRLSGTDGNAFVILGRVSFAMRKHGVSRDEIDAFQVEAKAGTYDELLQTVMKWVEVE